MTCSNEEKHSTYKTFGIIAGLVLIVSGIIASGALTAAAPAFATKSGNPNLGQSGQHIASDHGKAACAHRTAGSQPAIGGIGNVTLLGSRSNNNNPNASAC